jgi:serine/threonine-protein kinase
VTPASETVVDEAVSQATIDDSSFSDGAAAVSVDELDFGSLPPIDLSTVPTQAPAAAMAPAAARSIKPVPRKSDKSRTSDHQQLLLGIGLAVAIIALIATIGATIHSLNKPLEQVIPKIKSVEDGNGGHVIVVN